MGDLRMRIGSRSSRLSQAQTAIVTDLISRRMGGAVELEVVKVKTLGDRAPPASWGGKDGAKGAFTGDIETLLISGEIDVAIHSMKDLPSQETAGLVIGATPPRSDPRDALVTADGRSMEKLPKGAKVGTSSLRRKSQLLRMRPDLDILDLHGNVDTRIRKVASGKGSGLDAVVLAVAGLQRLGEERRISQTFSIEEMVPAVGQGIIAVQMREGDKDVEDVIRLINDEATALESSCERAFALRLGVDCNVPVGGCARASGSTMKMVGVVAKEDGSNLTRRAVAGRSGEAAAMGKALADDLLGRAAS